MTTRSPNMQPQVSVVIPTYNSERTIAGAIDSVLEQAFDSLEVIVVDDGSADATIRRVQQFQDNRIRFRVSGAIVALRRREMPALRLRAANGLRFLIPMTFGGPGSLRASWPRSSSGPGTSKPPRPAIVSIKRTGRCRSRWLLARNNSAPISYLAAPSRRAVPSSCPRKSSSASGCLTNSYSAWKIGIGWCDFLNTLTCRLFPNLSPTSTSRKFTDTPPRPDMRRLMPPLPASRSSTTRDLNQRSNADNF